MLDFAIDAKTAAKLLGISLREMEFWRTLGVGPTKLNIRLKTGWGVFYVKSEIVEIANDKEKLIALRAEYRAKRTLQRKSAHARAQTPASAETCSHTTCTQSPPDSPTS